MIFLWLLTSITFGYATTIAAGVRNRDPLLWYWCGFLGTFVAFLVVISLPSRAPDHRQPP